MARSERTDMRKSLVLEGRECHILNMKKTDPEGTVFLWAYFPHEGNELERMEAALSESKESLPAAVIAYEIHDWNAELSPWPAKAAFGDDDFAGDGPALLHWIETALVPMVRKNYPASRGIVPMGYSLAGLFSLWAVYESRSFCGVICASGSLWLDGWEEYAAAHPLKVPAAVYLSLGTKEEKTRNRMMARVGDLTRKQEALLKEDMNAEYCTLEWNPGGHFADSVERLMKGIWQITGFFDSEAHKGHAEDLALL